MANDATYDTLIIGAGLSGLAAGIRLAHYGKKVCICEQHHRIGGLNSYYERENFKLETGLHAMTNFVSKKGSKSSPLLKLLRQLRIPYDSLQLREQNHSLIKFPGIKLRFTNDFECFRNEISTNFPDQIDGFDKLDNLIMGHNELDLESKFSSAKKQIDLYISEPILRDMILCPLMYYGSALEDDMDFSQFVIMYKSIYKEGFCRPGGTGIRSLLDLLKERFTDCGGELINSSKIVSIQSCGKSARSLINKSGDEIKARNILSTAGKVETLGLCDTRADNFESIPRGELSYLETIAVLGEHLDSFDQDDTIIFFNDSNLFNYRKPKEIADFSSGVICFPTNFKFESGDELPDRAVRITSLANYQKWNSLNKSEYNEAKSRAAIKGLKVIEQNTSLSNLDENSLFIDTFTPNTIERYTGHIHGAIYGSPDKVRNGRTHLDNLFLCGTDQGFLGITGSMLSGISIANKYLLV